jgi:hypothetical protein
MLRCEPVRQPYAGVVFIPLVRVFDFGYRRQIEHQGTPNKSRDAIISGNIISKRVNNCSAWTGQNRVTWKTPSSAAFVPLQEPVAVLAFLRSPHLNAGMKLYECGHTQP